MVLEIGGIFKFGGYVNEYIQGRKQGIKRKRHWFPLIKSYQLK